MSVDRANSTCEVCGAEFPRGTPLAQCPTCLLQAGIVAGQPTAEDRTFPLPIETVGDWFSDIQVRELIGWGGMGAVYGARQIELGRSIALKVVPLEQPDELVPPERVAREAQALARLSHPQIVTIYEVRRAADHLCLLMELVEGGNLRQRLRRGPLDPAEMVPLVQQICAGLAHAHAQGVVHRDIKPENILLAADGTAKIADFGLAKMAPRGSVLSPVLTRSGQVMGSAHYVAPEQLEMMEQVDQRADLYALGVMLYEMLTGTRPAIDYRPPSRLRPLDWRYDAVVQRLLRRNPADRYPTAEAVAEQIRKIAGSATPPRRRWLVGGALAAAAVVALSVAVWQFAPRTEQPVALPAATLADLHGVLAKSYVDLKNPTATYFLDDPVAEYSIRAAVDGVSHAGGWSVLRHENEPQAAVFQTVVPIDAEQLVFEIENDGGGFPGHKPQRFRLYATTQPEPTIDDPAETWSPLAGLQVRTSHPQSEAELEADGLTVRVTGSGSVPDDYFLTADGQFQGLTGFKLELLPGPNGFLGFGGPTGNDVHITEFEVLSYPPPPALSGPRIVPLVDVWASYAPPEPAHRPAELIDGNLRGASFWLVDRGAQFVEQVAVVRPAEPVSAKSMTVELMHNGSDWSFKLQRFRLSVTHDPQPTATSSATRWTPIVPERVTFDPPGLQATWNDQGYITVSEGQATAQCSYLVSLAEPVEGITALRLEACPGPDGALGFAKGGGVVHLSELRLLVPNDQQQKAGP